MKVERIGAWKQKTGVKMFKDVPKSTKINQASGNNAENLFNLRVFFLNRKKKELQMQTENMNTKTD